MTSSQKAITWKIFTGASITLLAALIIWIITSVVKENRIYGQMRQTPERLDKIEFKINSICNKTDSVSDIYTIHNVVQIEQVKEINKKIDILSEKMDRLIELELAKK
jgi:hypothetical protein